MPLFIAVGPNLNPPEFLPRDVKMLTSASKEKDSESLLDMSQVTISLDELLAGDLLNEDSLVTLYGHAGLNDDKTIDIDLFLPGSEAGENFLDQILSIHRQKRVNKFCILACHSGAVINELRKRVDSGDIKLEPGFQIVSFGSSSQPSLTHKNDAILQKLIRNSQEDDPDLSDEKLEEWSLEQGVTVKKITFDASGLTVGKYVAHKHPAEYLAALDKNEGDRSPKEVTLLKGMDIQKAYEESLSRGEYGRAKEWFDIKFRESGQDLNSKQKLKEFLFNAYAILCKGSEPHMESFLVVLSEYTKKNEHLNPVFQEILSLELESPDWSLKLITELLTRGADVNFRNKYVLETPIETSLRNADPRLMNLLIGLGGGFDFGKNNNEVLKPLLLILNNPKLWTDKKPDIKKCFDIFIENAPKDSPLDYALAKEVCDIIFTKDYLFIEFAEPLFQYIGTQKDPDTKNNFFHQAVMEGDSDLAMDILEYGLCIDLISQPNSAKKTPLMLALENDHLGLAKKMFSSLDVVGQIKALNELTFDGKKEAGEELLDIIFDNMEKTSKSKNPPSTSFMLKKREALTNKDLKKALDKHLETIPEAVTKIRGKIKTLEKNNSQCTIS